MRFGNVTLERPVYSTVLTNYSSSKLITNKMTLMDYPLFQG